MDVKVGSRLKSAVCDTEVMVVRAPGATVDLWCGGQPMVAAGEAGSGELDPEQAGGTMMGKRYVDEAGTIELLCTKAGKGTLSIAGAPLFLKEAKPLPASD
jgi:hypothetical protein